MRADIDENDFLVANEQFQSDATAHIDRDRMKALQLSVQGMEAKRWVVGVYFQQL